MAGHTFNPEHNPVQMLDIKLVELFLDKSSIDIVYLEAIAWLRTLCEKLRHMREEQALQLL